MKYPSDKKVSAKKYFGEKNNATNIVNPKEDNDERLLHFSKKRFDQSIIYHQLFNREH